jgi:ABC-2 type transport system permease protein
MMAKEFRQVFRDPRMLRVIFIAPMIQLTVFGYAVSTDITKTRTFVVDHDRTKASRELIDAVTAANYFRVIGRSDRPADLVYALERGDAVVGIEIPAGYARDLQRDGGAEVQVLFDGTNSNTATVASGYAQRIIQEHALAVSRFEIPEAVDLRERAWFNPDLDSRNYNVPAVAGSLIMLISLILTSLAVVREHEIGTLEQLRVSPLTAGELIIGKTIPFATIALADLALITAISLLWFGVPFRGSVLVLLLAGVLYILSGLGTGLLISTYSRTQQQAFMTSFLVIMPTILLSGFMFPVSSMPRVFQVITLVNPVRHFIEIVRAVFLKGTGIAVLWPQFLMLLVIGSVLLWIAARRFRRSTA